MKLTPTTLLAALVLIGGGCFFAGRLSAPESSTAQSPVSGDTKSSHRSERLDESRERKEERSSRSERSNSTDSAEQRNARLASIVRGESLLDRQRAMIDYIDQLGPGEFEGAIEHFRSLGLDNTRNGEFGLLLSAWAKLDPMAAMAYAKDKTNGNFASTTIMATWASSDPDAALSWATSNFTGDGANPYLIGIIRAVAETDPARATTLLTDMPRSRERGDAMLGMLPHIMKEGAEPAREWVDQIADENLRAAAMNGAVGRLAEIDPPGTVDWLLANPGQTADRRLDDTFETWAQKDMSAAAASFSSLPKGQARTNALRGMMQAITPNDPQAGLALLQKNSADVTDRVWNRYVWSSFNSNPSLAVSQIANIGDQGNREQAYTQTLGEWLNRDAPAAKAWISRNNLPPNVVKNLPPH